MSTQPSPIHECVSPTQLVEINRICDRFEAEWRAGGRPLIEQEIALAEEPVRSALLRELLAIELGCRRSAGQSPQPAEYRARFPGDGTMLEAAFAPGRRSIPSAAPGDDSTVPQEGGPLGSGSPGQTSGSDPAAIGRYTVIDRLGQGGFGRVYLALDRELDRRVAIKVPRPERISRPEDVEAYLVEARILARLDHPHIVPVHDVGRTDDGLCFVVSKYVEGTNLAARMAQGRPAFHDAARPAGRYYQLTHDYLVPSLRDWLTRKQRETRKGRAELRLAERAALWSTKSENRLLPSALEWATIRLLTRKRDWTDPQRKLMSRAGRWHGLRALVLLLVLSAALAGGLAVRHRVNEDRQANSAAGLVERVLDADTLQVPDIVAAMRDYRRWVDPALRAELERAPDECYQAHSAEHAWPSADLLPNDLGLFDMLGNVFEWTHDMRGEHRPERRRVYHDYINIQSYITEKHPRLLRGGTFNYLPALVRSANRNWGAPTTRLSNNGFRPARTYK